MLLDADTEEVPAPDGEPAEGCVDPELADPPLVALLPVGAELDDASDFDDEDSPGAVSAHATPWPAKTAAPTPSETASPPTRPIYREAPIASPLSSESYFNAGLWHNRCESPMKCPLGGRLFAECRRQSLVAPQPLPPAHRTRSREKPTLIPMVARTFGRDINCDVCDPVCIVGPQAAVGIS